MYLKPGCEQEYAKRHAVIWPELKKMITEDQGVSNYSIFWDKETNLLFAYQECSKDTNSQDTTDVDPITQKWTPTPTIRPSRCPCRSCSIWIEAGAQPPLPPPFHTDSTSSPHSFRALFSQIPQISQILLCVILTDSTDFTDATPTHCGEYLHQRTARPAPVTDQRILAGGRDMRRRMPHRGMQAGMKAGHYSRSGMRDKGENTCSIGAETSVLCHRQAPITTDAPRFAALHSHQGPYAASVKSVESVRKNTRNHP